MGSNQHTLTPLNGATQVCIWGLEWVGGGHWEKSSDFDFFTERHER